MRGKLFAASSLTLKLILSYIEGLGPFGGNGSDSSAPDVANPMSRNADDTSLAAEMRGDPEMQLPSSFGGTGRRSGRRRSR